MSACSLSCPQQRLEESVLEVHAQLARARTCGGLRTWALQVDLARDMATARGGDRIKRETGRVVCTTCKKKLFFQQSF